MINPATETGRVILRSYFTHSFSTKLYCERVMNGDPVDISISFVIYRKQKIGFKYLALIPFKTTDLRT